MTSDAPDMAALERRIEYLSTQVERLIDLHNPFPSPMTPFRKAALLGALTFEQEARAIKLFGTVHAFNSGNGVDLDEGLLKFPSETIQLFREYVKNETIDSTQVAIMLKTFIPGGDGVIHSLIEAWNSARTTQPSRDKSAVDSESGSS